MASKATTVEEQIQRLKERGMEISDESKAKEILLDIGYYRLGFYWYPFETDTKSKDRQHNFIPGTLFKDAVDLYYFDYELRNILLKYITRIEVHLRTKIIYIVSNAYPNSPTWFADPAIVTTRYANSFWDDQYEYLLKHTPILRHHHKKYINDRFAPAWKTIEFMSLGAVQVLFNQIRDLSLRLEISKQFNVRHTVVFDNYIDAIKNVRNACAHGKVLYDLHLSTGIRKGPAGLMPPGINNGLKGAIKVIGYLLQSISKNRYDELQEDITNLEYKFSELLKKINFSVCDKIFEV